LATKNQLAGRGENGSCKEESKENFRARGPTVDFKKGGRERTKKLLRGKRVQRCRGTKRVSESKIVKTQGNDLHGKESNP